MTVQKGISAFTFLGILGALLFGTLPLWFAIWPQTLGVTAVDLTAHILILIGMIGIYFKYAEKLGKFGLVAVITVVIGFIFQIFMKAASGFIKPVLLEYAPQTLENQIAPTPLGEIIMTSFIIFPLCIVLFGLAIGISKIPQRKHGFLLMVTPFGFVVPFGVFISPVLFAFVFIKIAFPIIRKEDSKPELSKLVQHS